jgi:hypothetical protein
MSATKAEANGIERWARAQERAMIRAAIEREADHWQPSSQVYATKVFAVIDGLPTLAPIEQREPGRRRA